MSPQTSARPVLTCIVGLSTIVPLALAWENVHEQRANRVYSRYFAASAEIVPGGPAVAGPGGTLLHNAAGQQPDPAAANLRPGDIVLDCGARQGVFVRQALMAGASRVIAIEPVPENVERLRRNFRYEIKSGAVVVESAGVWDREDAAQLSSAADGRLLTVPLKTIDCIVAELRLTRLDYIRTDVEDAGLEIIAGAEKTLAHFHPRTSLCDRSTGEDALAVPKMVRALVPGFAFDQACQCEQDRVALFY